MSYKTINMGKEDIANLIAKDRLGEAIPELLEVTKLHPALNKDVRYFSSDYERYLSEVRTSRLYGDEKSARFSKIVNGLLEIVEKLPDGTEHDHIKSPVEKTKPIPPPKNGNNNKFAWLIGAFGLLLAGVVFWWVVLREQAPTLRTIVVNLHGLGGILDNPLKEGSLTLSAVDIVFNSTEPIKENGAAVFDSIPANLFGQKVAFQLIDKKYRLKSPDAQYAIQEKINLQVEAIPQTPKPPLVINDRLTPFIGNWKNLKLQDGIERVVIKRGEGTNQLRITMEKVHEIKAMGTHTATLVNGKASFNFTHHGYIYNPSFTVSNGVLVMDMIQKNADGSPYAYGNYRETFGR